MIIRASVALTENTGLLTTPFSTHALIVGERAALIDASISAAGPRFIEELKLFLSNIDLLSCILITHAHFDHIGAIPHLRECIGEELEVCGSSKAAQILSEESYLKLCYEKNCDIERSLHASAKHISWAKWKKAVKIDKILEEDDVVDLGLEVKIKIIETPGHTTDSISYYVLPDLVLCPGEAIGSFHGKDNIGVSFGTSWNNYKNSLKKFFDLEINSLILPHTGALTKELAHKFIVKAELEATKLYSDLKSQLEKKTLIEVKESLLEKFAKEGKFPHGPCLTIHESSIETMINCILNPQDTCPKENNEKDDDQK